MQLQLQPMLPPGEYKRGAGWTCHSDSAFCRITLYTSFPCLQVSFRPIVNRDDLLQQRVVNSWRNTMFLPLIRNERLDLSHQLS